jgi:plasmid stability protein
MPVMIQIRNVPDALHRKLKALAAQEGLSLSEYLMEELRRFAELPTDEEMRERLARLTPVELGESAADAIRAEREERDRR